jgi:predicted DCC family thiol-disulfide oxidoreductase YuxK
MNLPPRPARPETPGAEHPVVLFDGVCKFCNAGVNFLLDHDRRGRLRFAPLQSRAGQALLEKFRLPTTDFDTFVLVEGDRCWTRSTAALRLTAYLDAPWPALFPLLLVPPFLRDWAYDLVARHRYRWFGKLDACRVPTPEVRERFLD